jgi:sugar/nucleoside kinase (ribokinase family)
MAEIYLRDLDDAGDTLPAPAGDGTPTGKCLVLVTPDAERSMNTFLGASERSVDEQLDEEAIARSDYLYMEGYLVTSPTGLAAAVRAREIAEKAGVFRLP